MGIQSVLRSVCRQWTAFFTLQTHHAATQSYSVGGQRSSGQLTDKPTDARPDYRGRWCVVSREHPGRPNPSLPPGGTRTIVCCPLGSPVLGQQRNSLDSNRRHPDYRAHPALYLLSNQNNDMFLTGYCRNFIPKSVSLNLPKPLTSRYRKENRKLNYPDPMAECEKVFADIKIEPEQATAVERETRSQTKSRLWFNMKAGRITASCFKAPARTDPANPSKTLIRQICYTDVFKFSIKATR
ncbi:UNVERIFIED_CONTAM: hypothetical protein FKN15_051319 [Acipenser sinensis]